jgi:DNA-binding transcriptional MerR regulator
MEVYAKDAAKILGVHIDTLKYWEEKGLIPPSRRNEKNGYRVYSEQEIKEIAKIRGIFDMEVNSSIEKYKISKSKKR